MRSHLLVLLLCGLAVPRAPAQSRAVALPPVKHPLCLTLDASGRVWVGTDGEGVWSFQPGVAGDKPVRHTEENGLAEPQVHALAVDTLGRVWAGHNQLGVSVWNGQSWRQYDRVTGPLGEHIFDIAVHPRSGEVWLATSAGISRYDETSEAKPWKYLTRLHGLPEDQVQSIAFDPSGDVYLGTQSHGLVIGRQADGYATWQRIDSPVHPEAKPAGKGIPCALINDVLVNRDRHVYVATNHGVARSLDQGKTWDYLRGEDWVEYAKGRREQPATLPARPDIPLLQEDHVRSLAEDGLGRVWLGHRKKGVEALQPLPVTGDLAVPLFRRNFNDPGLKSVKASGEIITALLPVPGVGMLWGKYGEGLALNTSIPVSPPPVLRAIPPAPPHPRAAPAPTVEQVEQAIRSLQSLSVSNAVGTVDILDEDWATQGDWLGRYGHKKGILCATRSPFSRVYSTLAQYEIKESIGSGFEDCLRAWCWKLEDPDRRVPYCPALGLRRPAGWDDHAEAYPWTREGPDLQITWTVTAGTHRVSLYFLNFDGKTKNNRFRDYVVDARWTDAAPGTPPVTTRVRDFHEGVYKRFLVTGPGSFTFTIRKNGSFNTMVSGVFADNFPCSPSPYDDWQTAWLAGWHYQAKRIPKRLLTDAPEHAGTRLWRDIGLGMNRRDMCARESLFRVMAYRYCQSVPLTDHQLFELRRSMWIWGPADPQEFVDAMYERYLAQLEQTPDMGKKLSVASFFFFKPPPE